MSDLLKLASSNLDKAIATQNTLSGGPTVEEAQVLMLNAQVLCTMACAQALMDIANTLRATAARTS